MVIKPQFDQVRETIYLSLHASAHRSRSLGPRIKRTKILEETRPVPTYSDDEQSIIPRANKGKNRASSVQYNASVVQRDGDTTRRSSRAATSCELEAEEDQIPDVEMDDAPGQNGLPGLSIQYPDNDDEENGDERSLRFESSGSPARMTSYRLRPKSFSRSRSVEDESTFMDDSNLKSNDDYAELDQQVLNMEEEQEAAEIVRLLEEKEARARRIAEAIAPSPVASSRVSNQTESSNGNANGTGGLRRAGKVPNGSRLREEIEHEDEGDEAQRDQPNGIRDVRDQTELNDGARERITIGRRVGEFVRPVWKLSQTANVIEWSIAGKCIVGLLLVAMVYSAIS
jgi:hypothetical protein